MHLHLVHPWVHPRNRQAMDARHALQPPRPAKVVQLEARREARADAAQPQRPPPRAA